MLIEFSVKNFKSIKERQTLSMIATSGGELRSSNTTQVLNNKLDLVNSAAIYGPNASGKTNLIKGMDTMRRIVLTSSQGQHGDVVGVTPYLFSKKTQLLPTEFYITFISQNIRYEYGFITTNEQILEEWLFAYPKGRSQEWINRKYNQDTLKFEWGNMDKLIGPKQLLQDATRPNALFLSTAIQLNNKQLQPVFDWFRLYFRTIVGNLVPNYTFELCKDSDSKQEIIHFLQAADFNINDLEVISKAVDLQDFIGDILPPKTRDAISITRKSSSKDKSEIMTFDVKTIHIGEKGEEYKLNIEDESSGTKKFLTYAGPWLDVLKHGYVLVVDELNNELHPYLIKFIIQMFHNKTINRNNAQLILTTHETSILRQDIFRRDQIWFTEKDEYNATNLFPLSDFNPRKNVENLETNYLNGRYGGLPYMRDVADLFRAEE